MRKGYSSGYLGQRARLRRRTPFLSSLRDQFELQLRGSFCALQAAPSDAAFNAIATIIDAIRLALDAKGLPEDLVIESGARALIALKEKHARTGALAMQPYEEAPIVNAINAIVEALKLISVQEFDAAMKSREGEIA